MGSIITDAGRALIAAKLAAAQTMPLTVVKFSDIAFVATLDNAAAVDKGGGLVGLPATAHGFKAGMIVVAAGTTNYDGTHTLDAGTTADELVITAAFTAETFAGTETATADPGTPPDPDPTATDLTSIVHTDSVSATGKINPDQVIYSAILDTTIGDFPITRVGFYFDDGVAPTLVLLSNLPIYHKRRVSATQQGNFYGHSPILSISRAATVAGVTVPPATWQFDFTERIRKGEDETRANIRQLLGRFAALNAALQISAIAPTLKDDCEATTNWAAGSGTLALDATSKTEGANSLKISGQAAAADMTKTLPAVEDWSAYNGMLVDVLGDSASNIAWFIEDSLGNRDKWNLVNQTAWNTHELDLLNPDVDTGADPTDIKKFGLEGLDNAVIYNLDNFRLARFNDFDLAAGDLFLEGLPFAPPATSHAQHLNDWNADATPPPPLSPPGAGTRLDGVYMDMWLDGDFNTIRVWAKLTVSASARADYTDGGGVDHYVEKIAEILRTTSRLIDSGMLADFRRVLPTTDLLGIIAKHVADEIAALVDASPAALDTLNELAAALGDDANFAATMTTALALKAPLASPALTGNPTAPTQATGDDTAKLATTAFIKALIGIVDGILGLDGSGGATLNGDLSIPVDGKVLKLGVGGDLQLYHPVGGTNFIKNIPGRHLAIIGGSTGAKNMLFCAFDGATHLYFNDAVKFQTDNFGGILTGRLAVDAIHELTPGAGVTGDGVLLKDSKIATANAVDQNAIAAAAVAQGKLKTGLQQSLGAFPHNTVVEINFTGATYTLGWSVGHNGAPAAAAVYPHDDANFLNKISLFQGTGVGLIYWFQARYVQASPPYDLGYGKFPLFVFLLIDSSGKIVRFDIAPDPPWANNGPTNIRPDSWKDKRTAEKRKESPPSEGDLIPMKRVLRKPALPGDPALMAAYLEALRNPVFDEVEITMAFKNTDMPLIPHPFIGNDLTGFSVVLLDPGCACLADLALMHEAEESVGEILHGEYVEIDNSPLAVPTPPGVLTRRAAWKTTA